MLFTGCVLLIIMNDIQNLFSISEVFVSTEDVLLAHKGTYHCTTTCQHTLKHAMNNVITPLEDQELFFKILIKFMVFLNRI